MNIEVGQVWVLKNRQINPSRKIRIAEINSDKTFDYYYTENNKFNEDVTKKGLLELLKKYWKCLPYYNSLLYKVINGGS